MHTFTRGNVRIHYNSDFSGDAVVTVAGSDTEMEVPCSALLAFAAEAVRRERISAIEDEEPHELLGLPKALSD
jgi:hypothetical protein